MEVAVSAKREITIAGHFEGRADVVKATYLAILAAARKLGPVREEAKKTSIHLARRTAFAGIATRRAGLILTLKSTVDIQSPRVRRREQASANRWYLEVELQDPSQIDAEIRTWLKSAYDLAD